MRKIYSILLALAFVGCTREMELDSPSRRERAFPEGAKVRVTLSIAGTEPDTKALGEGCAINTLHLAVFGGSGYLKEYVLAQHVAAGSYTYELEDTHGETISRTVPMYTFTVELGMSEYPRTIHFIGNGPAVMPFGYDTAVMPIQLSTDGEMAYWQMISVDGITAKKNGDGDFIDADGNVIPDGGSGYIADDKTELAFQGIPLIRNWSKIVLSAFEDSNFTPISFAPVSSPSRGAIAPYSASTGFITDYGSRSFTYLEDVIGYPGNLPAGTTFTTDIPSLEDFQPPFGEGVSSADGGAAYIYERPAPSAAIPPTFVLVYGHYRNPDDLSEEGDYFYKVDLMETKKVGEEFTSRYYPIFRNFKYQIVVKKILSRGHDTPMAAAQSAGSADVSADVSTQHLADISDGIGRLHVEPWMSQAFTRAHGAGNPMDILRVWFGSQDGVTEMDPSKVKVQILPPDDGGNDILYNIRIEAPSEEADDRGWRRIVFYNVAPGRTVRTQRIRITGEYEEGRLYRDIPITLQPIQPLSVRCGEYKIPSVKGARQSVIVDIPDGLVESMFPLDFTIEADRMTLTPDNSVAGNNLPVVSGRSISENPTYMDKPAFQFVKTLTWDDYLSLPRFEDEEERIWRSFTSYFLTTRENSASDVWVYNEFFDKGHDRFIQFDYKQFRNAGFTIPIVSEYDVSLPFSFEMTEDLDGSYPEDYPPVLVQPNGLRLDLGDHITAGPDPGTYYVRPTGHTVVLNFITTTSNPAEIEVNLSALDYEFAQIVPYSFPFAGLLDGQAMSNNKWSNVAWGYVNSDANKTVLFGYKDHPAKLNSPVTLTFSNGLKALSATFPVKPTGPRSDVGENNYHEIELSTVSNLQDAVFTLSSPGYITKEFRYGRFKGNIRTMYKMRENVFKQGNTYGFTVDQPSFEYTEDNGKIRVEFTEVSEIGSNSLRFNAGKTYTVTITSLNSDQTLFYVDFHFNYDKNKKIVYAPESFSDLSAGNIELYPGSNNQYVWHIPRGNLSASISFTAPVDQDVVLTNLYVKSMNGDILSGGNVIQN